MLNAAPYKLRDVPAAQPSYAQNAFGATFGGPLKIPGLYADTNRRTNFQLNFTGGRSTNLFNQYATVPTDAMRNGDFCRSITDRPVDRPAVSGQPDSSLSINPGAASLLPYIPAPNLPGTTNNFHASTTARSSSEALSLRVTQNLSPTVVQGGRGGGRGGFGGGFGGRGGGPGGRGAPAGPRPTSIILNAQLQYRRNETQALNVFPSLGGDTMNTSISAPIRST